MFIDTLLLVYTFFLFIQNFIFFIKTLRQMSALKVFSSCFKKATYKSGRLGVDMKYRRQGVKIEREDNNYLWNRGMFCVREVKSLRNPGD